MKREKLLVILLSPSSFSMQDVKILEMHFEVKLLIHVKTTGLGYPIELTKFALHSIYLMLTGYRKTFSVFADTHMLVPVLLSKILGTKTYITIGGYEVFSKEEIDFKQDVMPKWRRNVIHFIIKHATVLLPKSHELAEKTIRIRGSKDHVITLFNGFDPTLFNVNTNVKCTPRSVLTIAQVSDYKTFLIKGIDRILTYAENNPDFHFTIVGIQDSMLHYCPKLKNLTIVKPVSHSETILYYAKNQFYLLPSRSEGMPNALCEAIFCGCIPLAFNAGNSKFIVHNPDFILQDESQAEFNRIVHLPQLEEASTSIRNRAESLFSLSTREVSLVNIISR